MSISRKFDLFNEECVVSFASEGDERLAMPLCGITHRLPHYRIQRDNATEWVIECVIAGSGVYRTGKLEFRPQAGDVYLAHFGSNHEYYSNPKDPWEKIWFNLQGSLVADLMRSYGLDTVYHIRQCGMEPLFRAGLEAMRQHPEEAHETATLVTHRLLYHLSRYWYGVGTGEEPEARRMRQWLDDRVTGSVTMAELARGLGRSPSQLTRIFTRQYGVAPYRYFLDRKLELARVMLRQSGNSVKEIAAELHFPDPYYFSNLFKRRFGLSPQHQRRADRQPQRTAGGADSNSAARA